MIFLFITLMTIITIVFLVKSKEIYFVSVSELHPKNWTQFLEVQFFYVKIFKRSKRKGYLSF